MGAVPRSKTRHTKRVWSLHRTMDKRWLILPDFLLWVVFPHTDVPDGSFLSDNNGTCAASMAMPVVSGGMVEE
jgi:hypothetical protein